MIDPIVPIDTDPDINIRSSRYWLARGIATCPHCRAATDVFGLGLPPGHETLVPGDGPDDVDTWAVSGRPAFIFHADRLSAVVQHRLLALTRSYRRGRGDESDGRCWSNHCVRCGSRLDDDDLYCEPGGAFLPMTEQAAAVIRLLSVHEVLEAAAGGYAYEPEFFAAMRRTELSRWLSIS